MSWLWDVDYEQLAGRTVIATGPRAQDLAVRLALRRGGAPVHSRPGRCGGSGAAHPVRPEPVADRLRHLHAVPASWVGSGVVAALTGPVSRSCWSTSHCSASTATAATPGGCQATGVARLSTPLLTIVEPGDPLPDTGQVYLLGGGEDAAQVSAVRALAGRRRAVTRAGSRAAVLSRSAPATRSSARPSPSGRTTT